jgi:hypothetical protein
MVFHSGSLLFPVPLKHPAFNICAGVKMVKNKSVFPLEINFLSVRYGDSLFSVCGGLLFIYAVKRLLLWFFVRIEVEY